MFKNNCYCIFNEEQQKSKLTTSFKDLDNALHGGVAPGRITEIAGGPGTGKTQICMQMSLSVQCSRKAGGLGGKSLYIDTNQDFSPVRLKEIAEFNEMYISEQTSRQQFKINSVLDNVLYKYCSNHLELFETIMDLKNICKTDSTIKLIVVDSFSFLLRCMKDIDNRKCFVYTILTELQKLAVDFEVAIVLTNELTTVRTHKNDWRICPALGGSFAHKINERIICSKDSETNMFYACVDKSINSKKIAIPFQHTLR